jgi:cystathionine beta-lyase/cystathionine gamma-synthase
MGGRITIIHLQFRFLQAVLTHFPSAYCKRNLIFVMPVTNTPMIIPPTTIFRIFYGHGTVEDLDHLERHLESERRIRGLLVETPSNPLLWSLHLIRRNSLARKSGFAIIVDETIGKGGTPIIYRWIYRWNRYHSLLRAFFAIRPR